MKINSINCINANSNFSGLWGRTSRKTDTDSVINIPRTVTTKYYYPFKNETEEQISEAIKGQKSADILSVNGGPRKYIIHDCKVCATLPFTEDEYGWYTGLTEASLTRPDEDSKLKNLVKKIHMMLQNKFTDDPLTQKESAQNPIIENLIQENRL